MKTNNSLRVVVAILVSLISFLSVSAENAALNQSAATIVESDVNEKGGYVMYEVVVDHSSKYDISMWQCASMTLSKDIQTYTISLDNEDVSENVVPEKSGWSFLTMSSPIFLAKGKHFIRIGADLPQIPNVEFVKVEESLTTNSRRMLSSDKYDKYLSDIKSGAVMKNYGTGSGDIAEDKDSLTMDVFDPTMDVTPYGFKHYKIPWFGYTFYTTVYLKEGQTLHCVSESPITHHMEIYSANMPEKYSWSKMSTSGNVDYVLTIPYTDVYYVRVRSHKNGSTGLCKLNVNDIMVYEDVPICSMGVRSNFASETAQYNVFTANAVSNPLISINKGTDANGKVAFYNDDFHGVGDFDWGWNARINRSFTKTRIPYRILVFSSGSYNPMGGCELYVGCKNSTISAFFENLKDDDAIASARASAVYNCISWSGGISSYWEWPLSAGSAYNIPDDDLGSFDYYYSSERYPGCSRYTRVGATESNSVVDLWGLQTGGHEILTHGSIRNNSDGNYHGYDWESKPGGLTRTFHPRYALKGVDYGNVLYHYRMENSTYSVNSSLELAIAEDRAIMDNVELSTSQEMFLESLINDIGADKISAFNSYYANWENAWTNSVHSNPEKIKENIYYNMLREYCMNNGDVKYMVYDKINSGFSSAIPLFEDLYVLNDNSNRRRINSIHLANNNQPYDDNGRKFIRTPLSNFKLLIKQLIPANNVENVNISGNPDIKTNDNIKIVRDGENYTINLSVSKKSNILIDVLSIDGRVLRTLVCNEGMAPGFYDIPLDINKDGVVLIRYSLNGNVVVKKLNMTKS